jgi:glycogen synthase
VVAELQPNLIHINGFVYGSLPWQAPKLVVAHSDVFSWWQAVKGEAPTPDWNEYFNRGSAGLKAADYLVAPSGWMLQEVRKIYGTEVPGEAIYNGRSAAQFHPDTKEKKVLSMGRIWDVAKNIQLLVKAAAEIDYPVLLAGEAHFEHNDTATEGANVQYLGKLSTAEVAAQLSTAAVYVLPAKYEPFGLSVLEAALSGCALVLGNIETLKEIWGDAALYVDTDDAEALAATVNSLLENEFLLTLYAEAAQQRAVQYSTEKMAEKYWEVYGKMVKRQ